MKKKLIWLGLFAASVALVFVVFRQREQQYLVLSLLFMIGVHELGHLGMAKYLGYKTGGFYFIPGLGGVALLKEMPKKRWHDFLIFYAGPAVGFLETLILIAINLYLQWPLVWLIAIIWAMVNLFNLLVALPLDGGKIIWAIASGEDEKYLSSLLYYALTFISLLAIGLSGAFFWVAIIFFFGFIERKLIASRQDLAEGMEPMTAGKKITALGLYFLLIAQLFGLVYFSAIFLMAANLAPAP